MFPKDLFMVFARTETGWVENPNTLEQTLTGKETVRLPYKQKGKHGKKTEKQTYTQ